MFGAIKLVELCEKARKIDIGRMMFDKIFQKIIARFRRFRLQVRVRDLKKRRHDQGVTRAFRPFHQPFKNRERAFRMLLRHFETAEEKAPRLAFRCRSCLQRS